MKRALASAFFALLACSFGFGQSIRVHAQAEAAPAFGALADISPWSLGGSLGVEVDDLFLPRLSLDLDLGYSVFHPVPAWVASLSQATALVRAGYRFDMGSDFSVTPRVSLGAAYVFSSASYFSGDYESYTGLELLAGAGMAADYPIAKSLYVTASADFLLIADSRDIFFDLPIGLGVGWKIR